MPWSEEAKAAAAERMRAQWADPEFVKKAKSPETRANRSAAQKLAAARRHEKKIAENVRADALSTGSGYAMTKLGGETAHVPVEEIIVVPTRREEPLHPAVEAKFKEITTRALQPADFTADGKVLLPKELRDEPKEEPDKINLFLREALKSNTILKEEVQRDSLEYNYLSIALQSRCMPFKVMGDWIKKYVPEGPMREEALASMRQSRNLCLLALGVKLV